MIGILNKYFQKLYFKHWIIGICRSDIKEIIRNKKFSQNIKWLSINSTDHYNADPFILRANDGNLNILFEDLKLDDQYGKIFLLTIDNKFKIINKKLLIDTESHLSYPFIFKENGRIFIFPEASRSGKLVCYEYNLINQSMIPIKDIINLPLLDSTILKYHNKYWLFGTLNGDYPHSRLCIFYSDNLLGPYQAHPQNPVSNALNGSRPGGNFIEVDGAIFRPSQNCQGSYGESLTINKIIRLDEFIFEEEPYMSITIDSRNLQKHRIHTIHTINFLDDIIVVDGQKWTFSPLDQWKFHMINKRSIKQSDSKQLSH